MWRTAQITVRMDPKHLADTVQKFCLELERYETSDDDSLLVTVIAHPQLSIGELTGKAGEAS
jgi:hypothetical protein